MEANDAQRRYWNEVAGPRWVAGQGFRERRNQESLALLLDRLCLAGGEHVLEIGCGTAAVTLPLARAVGEDGRVVAVDISEPMLKAARQRIEESGLRNITLLTGDAQSFAFEPAGFDVATSRMGVMFFAEPVTAFRNIRGALKTDGRLAFACWAPLAENRHWLISYEIAVRLLGPPATDSAAEKQKQGFVVQHNYVGSGQGTVVRVVEFSPGAPKFMHRTETLDYGIVLSGECDLELDDGEMLRVRQGDIVVQRGTMHAWVNNGTQPCVFVFVLIDANPAQAGTQTLRTHYPV